MSDKRDRSALMAMRAERKSRGECKQCGKDAMGFALCWHCRQQRANRYRRKYKTNAMRATWLADYYKRRDVMLTKQKAKRDARRKAGLCAKCGEVPVEKFNWCIGCRARHRELRLMRLERRANAGGQ